MLMMEFELQPPGASQVQVSSWVGALAPSMTPGHGSKPKWAKAIGKLTMMMSLEDDWDGMGAEAPSREIVLSAIELADKLRSLGYPPPTRVAATPAGTVGLEWQESAIYLEAEVVTPYRSEWMLIADGMPPVHGVISRSPFIDPLMEGMPPAYWVD